MSWTSQDRPTDAWRDRERDSHLFDGAIFDFDIFDAVVDGFTDLPRNDPDWTKQP